MNTDDSIATRASLLNRLKDCGDDASWQKFFDTYWKLIHGVARKAGLSEEDAKSTALDLVWDAEWEKTVFDLACQRVRRQVAPEHWQIFDLYVVKRLTIGGVEELLGTNAARIYLAKHRVAKLMKAEVERLEAKGV